jgi:hypothetical protein
LPQRGGAIVLIAAAYLSISGPGLSAVREHRNDWVDSPGFTERVSLHSNPILGNAHPFWDQAYISLGYFPNDYGIFYRDDVALETGERLDPEAAALRYYSPEYERSLRDRYFEIVRDDPVFYLLNLGGKIAVTVGHNALWLALLALLGPFALSVVARSQMMRRCMLLLTPAIVLGFLQAVATVPYRPYEIGLSGALGMSWILLAAWLAAEAESLNAHSSRRPHSSFPAEPLAHLRSSVATPNVRRQARWAAAGLLLVAILFFVSKPLKREANDWQIENGGIPLSERSYRIVKIA